MRDKVGKYGSMRIQNLREYLCFLNHLLQVGVRIIVESCYPLVCAMLIVNLGFIVFHIYSAEYADSLHEWQDVAHGYFDSIISVIERVDVFHRVNILMNHFVLY